MFRMTAGLRQNDGHLVHHPERIEGSPDVELSHCLEILHYVQDDGRITSE